MRQQEEEREEERIQKLRRYHCEEMLGEVPCASFKASLPAG